MHNRRNVSFGLGRRLARASAALLLTAGLVAAVSGCGGDAGPTGTDSSVGAPGEGVGLVDARAFADLVEQPGTVVLDVRTAEEFAAGHLLGAINSDVQDPGFAEALADLDPDARYAVYCRSGNRSAVAVALMAAAGFGDVVHLDGGINAWVEAKRPLVTG